MHHDVIGTGPIGFTAIGLDLTCEQVLGRLSLPADAEVAVEVPAFTVVAADNFSAFLERNRFDPQDFVGLSNRQIARRFQRGELPEGLRDQLSDLPVSMEGPLIVRPSSVLESSLRRSLGEVYLAKLIPNKGADLEKRRRQLIDAIKLVWASTYFPDAVNSRLGAGESVEAEQMAVVVQRALGSYCGDRFYPTVSVVARSYNHYPAPGNKPDEGVVTLGLGLGKIIAEGHAWSYCPERPTAPPPFRNMNDLLKNSQKSFWAVDLSGSRTPDPVREDEHLVRLGLADAETDGTLDLLASTYDSDSDRLRAGIDGAGPRAVTFAPLLRSRSIPFTSVVKTLLDSARMATGSEVEIELAAVLDPVNGIPVRFGVVKLNTMPGRTARDSVSMADLSADGVIAASTSCLGDGTRADLQDIVYLKPDAFDRHRTRTVAAELEAVNRDLLEEGRRAVFLGFGRWGTTDERYGVPVRWGQISSAQVIVEITMPDVPPNLSHGTHFFHNLLSQRVLYLSVEHDGPHEVDFGWLDEAPGVWEGRYVRHVRPESALRVNVDGGSGLGVIER